MGPFSFFNYWVDIKVDRALHGYFLFLANVPIMMGGAAIILAFQLFILLYSLSTIISIVLVHRYCRLSSCLLSPGKPFKRFILICCCCYALGYGLLSSNFD